MIISLIVAASKNNVIGVGGRLPWSLPNDLRYFRERTQGKPVIMGRKTFDSIGKPLPNRSNIIVTRQPRLKVQGCIVVHSLDEALKVAEEALGAKEAFIIGGAEIFKEALPKADRVYLTHVHTVIEGDAFFLPLDSSKWEEVSREEHEEDQRHLYAYTFCVYERRTLS
ncbi:MAG: dihydrofolate reductase [Candidatus Peribacteraceae bacterium]|jgi:dihydrofolate reductase